MIKTDYKIEVTPELLYKAYKDALTQLNNSLACSTEIDLGFITVKGQKSLVSIKIDTDWDGKE